MKRPARQAKSASRDACWPRLLANTARRILRKQLKRMLRHEPGVRLGIDPEHLHDMRVALRRLREALRVFRDTLPARETKVTRKQSRRVASPLGEVRDLDVYLLRIQEETRRARPALARGLELYQTKVFEERKAARRKMLRVLDGKQYAGFVSGCSRLIKKSAALSRRKSATRANTLECARKFINKRLAKALRDGASAIKTPNDATLHRLRIRCKRLRYSCEFFADVLGQPATRCASRLADLQNVLGAHHDAVVGQELLRRLTEEVRGAGRIPPGLGQAIRVLKQRGERKVKSQRTASLRGWASITRGPALRALKRRLGTSAQEE